MAFHANAIGQKCEIAFRDYLRAAPLVNFQPEEILAGANNYKRRVPSVVCVCKKSTPETPQGSNWWCDLEVAIRVNAMDEPAESLAEEAGEIIGYFFTGATLAQDISDATEEPFTAFSVLYGEPTFAIENKTWITTQPFRVCCAGSDIG